MTKVIFFFPIDDCLISFHNWQANFTFFLPCSIDNFCNTLKWLIGFMIDWWISQFYFRRLNVSFTTLPTNWQILQYFTSTNNWILRVFSFNWLAKVLFLFFMQLIDKFHDFFPTTDCQILQFSHNRLTNLEIFHVTKMTNFMIFSHAQLVNFCISPHDRLEKVVSIFHVIDKWILWFFSIFTMFTRDWMTKFTIYFSRSIVIFCEFFSPMTGKGKKSKRCMKKGC